MDEEAPPSYLCPKCDLPLTRIGTSVGVFWGCSGCGGRAITVELLRRMFTPDSINTLWRHAMTGKEPTSARACPSCRRAMLEVPLSETDTVRVDVCRLCHFVWFDAHETETLVPRPVQPKPKARIPAKAIESPSLSDPWVRNFWWDDVLYELLRHL